MKADTWMAFYVGDYVTDTMHLTTRQHGAYLLLIIAAWKGGGWIAGSDAALMAITRLSHKEWQQDAPALLPFFVKDGDRLRHNRVALEWNEAQRRTDTKKRAGKGGGEARWGSNEGSPTASMTRSERLANARAMGAHTKEEWNALVQVMNCACVRCRMPATELSGGVLCKDHIKPIYQGGDDSIQNIQPMCRNCNSSKGPEARDYRFDVYQDWAKRLAERLAERAADAQQTPAHLQIQLPVTTTDQVERGAFAPCAKEGANDGRRGTRLSADWQPSSDERGFAADLGIDPDATADAFRDYWVAVPGAKGRKLDWPATWRGWCRRETARPVGKGATGRLQPTRGNDAFYQQLADIARRADD
jgi:uncharacterized protein YdaU (DUF1376 family)